MNEVLERVKKITAEQLDLEESKITPESSFINDLGADSLDTVELIMAMEDQFDIEIPDEEAQKISTVKEAAEYISNKIAKKEEL